MTRNRLAEAALADEPRGELQPGDTRTVTRKDGGTLTIDRTGRPYAYDLRDAYNAAMSLSARQRGLEWFVDAKGELRIGFTDAAMQQVSRQIAQRKATGSSRALQRSFEQ